MFIYLKKKNVFFKYKCKFFAILPPHNTANRRTDKHTSTFFQRSRAETFSRHSSTSEWVGRNVGAAEAVAWNRQLIFENRKGAKCIPNSEPTTNALTHTHARIPAFTHAYQYTHRMLCYNTTTSAVTLLLLLCVENIFIKICMNFFRFFSFIFVFELAFVACFCCFLSYFALADLSFGPICTRAFIREWLCEQVSEFACFNSLPPP